MSENEFESIEGQRPSQLVRFSGNSSKNRKNLKTHLIQLKQWHIRIEFNTPS